MTPIRSYDDDSPNCSSLVELGVSVFQGGQKHWDFLQFSDGGILVLPGRPELRSERKS